jgi:alpha-L-glutamate ligase-like protein
MEILGMNERNLSFIRPYNKGKALKLADDKLLSKKILKRTGIPTPKIYGVMESIKDIEEFKWDALPKSFVVKPSQGFGGEGILILFRREKKSDFIKKPLEKRSWYTSSGEEYSFENLRSHVLDIIDGNYSLSGLPDKAYIERKLNLDPVFKKFVRKGIPDIRVIVFNKVSIMAMLRMPTEQSKGRANITQGAIAAGIDIGTGITTTGMKKTPYRRVIVKHPDTNQEIAGLQIPYWDKIVEMSGEAQIATKLGFLGVDIGIDKKYGPEILEINARSGLDIQIANLEGLSSRLKRVKGLKVKSVSHGVRIAKDLFGGDVERRVEEISGLEVVGIIETVNILNKKGTRKSKLKAKVDTGALSSSIDESLAKKLGFSDAIKFFTKKGLNKAMTKEEADKLSETKLRKEMIKHEDIVDLQRIKSAHGASFRIKISLVYYLAGKKIKGKVNITNRKGMEYPMLVGRDDLRNFLVDPNKNKPKK